MRVRNLTAVGYKCYQRVSFSEDFALLEESYGVAAAVLGHEGEEVGGLGTGELYLLRFMT